MSEERFDRIDATLEKLGARFDAVDAHLDAIDVRLDAIDVRFDAVDARFDRLEVLHEETRGKVDLALEHIVATDERLDRFERQVSDGFDKLTVDVRMVLDNHEVRIHDLEQH